MRIKIAVFPLLFALLRLIKCLEQFITKYPDINRFSDNTEIRGLLIDGAQVIVKEFLWNSWG